MQQPTLEVLCEQIQQGDSSAADRLITQTNSFVWKQVTKIWKEYDLTNGQLCFSKDDLYQEGCIGLLKAAQQYNPALSIPFLPYAKQAIRNAMIDQLRASSKHTVLSLNAPISVEREIVQLNYLQMMPHRSYLNVAKKIALYTRPCRLSHPENRPTFFTAMGFLTAKHIPKKRRGSILD